MVFRVKKNKNYTVMSNYHLRDKRLSLKAKGLLSQMLSLPEDWNYTARGLAAINKENYHTIRGIIGELEDMGYIVRRQRRGKFGEWNRMEYDIYEIPRSTEEEEEASEADAPETEVSQTPAEVSQPETEVPPPREERTASDALNLHLKQIPLPPRDKQTESAALDLQLLNKYRREIRENVDFETLWREHGEDITAISAFVEMMAETGAGREPIRVSGRDIHPMDAIDRFKTLNREHILYVLECLKGTRTEIKNIRAYTLAALYNAPLTIEQYYEAKVRHDIK